MDRQTDEYQEFLAASLIIGRTMRDMGELTGKPEQVIEQMAGSIGKGADSVDVAVWALALMYELAWVEADAPARESSPRGSAMQLFPFRIPTEASGDLRTIAMRRGAKPSVLVREWLREKINQHARSSDGRRT